MTIVAHRHFSSRKFLYVLIAEAIFCQYTAHANTIIAIKRTADFIIIAADSLTTNAEGKPNDHETCKISRLDEKSVFAASGVVSGEDSGTLFDVRDQAKIHYVSTVSMSGNAEKWARAIQSLYHGRSNEWKGKVVSALTMLNSSEVVTHEIFARATDHIDAASVEITYSHTPLTIDFDHRPSEEIPIDIALWGPERVNLFINKLLRGDSEIAARWQRIVHSQASTLRYGEIDTYAYELKSAVDRAIESDVDPGIGGDVAVLILEPQKPVRWFNQTPACKD
jgi:hypothetical protein